MRETCRPLGSTDLSVFAVALGGTAFGMKAGTRESHRLLDTYRAGGGNFLDTADSYRPPVEEIAGFDSESIIGSWLKTSGARDEMVIATKVGKHPAYPGLRATNIRRAAEASLRRLRTDRIDLYFAHFDDQGVPLEETASAFSELVDAGMIRHIGLSDFSGKRVSEWMDVAARNGLHPPVAVQPHYNVVERSGFETDLMPVALHHALATVPTGGSPRDSSPASTGWSATTFVAGSLRRRSTSTSAALRSSTRWTRSRRNAGRRSRQWPWHGSRPGPLWSRRS